MPKYVYVQVKGVEKALRLLADKVEKKQMVGSLAALVVSVGNETIGEFKDVSIDGWWIQDERE